MPSLTHLIYADEILIFMQADTNGAQAVKKVFQKLEKYNGLQINTEETRVIFSKECAYKGEMLNILPFPKGKLPWVCL